MLPVVVAEIDACIFYNCILAVQERFRQGPLFGNVGLDIVTKLSHKMIVTGDDVSKDVDFPISPIKDEEHPFLRLQIPQ